MLHTICCPGESVGQNPERVVLQPGGENKFFPFNAVPSGGQTGRLCITLKRFNLDVTYKAGQRQFEAPQKKVYSQTNHLDNPYQSKISLDFVRENQPYF